MQRQQGFTLIELLVVIAIIGILATLVITQLSGATVKARNAGAQSDVTEAGKAIQIFANDDAASGAVIATGSGATTATWNNTTFTSTASNYFSGGALITTGSTGALRYGTTITKSPSTNYTYNYKAGSATPTDIEGAKTISLTPVYSFCTNIKAVAGAATDSAFQSSQAGTAAVTGTCP